MRIKDIINKMRNINFVMIHKDEGSISMFIDELDEKEKEFEFQWFEVTIFKGKTCIEFNL